MAGMKGLLKSLAENFTERFNDFKIPKQVILFVRNPFAVDVSGSCPAEAKAVMPGIDEAAFQLELVQFQSVC
ncbi:hypothetical protein NHX12_013872 [Muraenolepis orangiensis]|uniref:Uncharacterized protein n=1 Tax=Muraenolepis orangiensis TaxID=630683 RepID=A0A9Q0DAX4_9TELE|nr:hypothetical protein NHX12_013872 [Muraenolepis orangiensis]